MTARVGSGPKYVVAQLENLGIKELQEKLVPKGNSRSISKEPSRVDIDEEEIDEGIILFESLMEPALKDVLYAQPIGIKPTEDAELFEDLQGDWEWDYMEYTYSETETGERLEEDEKDERFLTLLDLYILMLLAEISSLILKEVSIQRWVTDTRRRVSDGTVAGYLFGVGGKNVLDVKDLSLLSKLIKGQFTYFQKFAEEIKNGELSGANILQRISMYGESITNGYEQAKAKSHGIILPEYPADGSQKCLSNCRCRWVLKDDTKDANAVLATWTLNPTAEHCETCVSNSRKWNPLRVKKGGR